MLEEKHKKRVKSVAMRNQGPILNNMNNATNNAAFETLGRLAVEMGDTRLANRLDDDMSQTDFHSYLNGVDSKRAEIAAIASAIDDAFNPSKCGFFHPISPVWQGEETEGNSDVTCNLKK